MKKFIYIISVIFCFTIKTIGQKPIIIWDEISFNCVKIPDMDKTIIHGKDTIVKGRLIPAGSLWIQLSGRIINAGKTTLYLRKEESPISSFKIEYLYKKRKNSFYLDYQIKKGCFDDIELLPKKQIEIVLESQAPFLDNKEIYKIDKKDYLQDVLEILPTLVLKCKIATDDGNTENVIFYDYETNNIRSTIIHWDNYIPLFENGE